MFAWFAGLMLLVAACTGTGAEESPPLHLAQVVDAARQHNPEIRAAQRRVDAAAAVPRRVSGLDDPMFTYESWNAPESLRLDEADNNIFRVSQKLPFPGKRALAGKVAEHE